MDNLPQEIVDHIVSFIPRKSHETHKPESYLLPPLATVSRKFQKAVERRTFENILISTRDTRIDEFERIWSPQRRPSLRTLGIELLVCCCRPEDLRKLDQYRRQVDIEATMALRRLWNFLSSAWSEISLDGGNVQLTLATRAADDPADVKYGSCLPLNLTADVGSFPALPFIRSVRIVPGFCHWHPRVPMVLTSSLPNLENVQWILASAYDDWGCCYSIDKQCRNGLVQSIQAGRLPSSVKYFSASLKQPTLYQPDQMLPRFIENNMPDPLSLAMRDLTRHCDEIDLRGSFSPTLFDPPRPGRAAEEQPCWQSTTKLKVNMALDYPDGSRLFQTQTPAFNIYLPEGLINCNQLLPGYGDTKEERETASKYFNDYPKAKEYLDHYPGNSFTFIPDDEKLNTLFTAFARCCARMPALKKAVVQLNGFNYLWRPNVDNDNWPFMVSCVAPFPNVDGSSTPWSVNLCVGNWRPTRATITKMEKIGEEKDGRTSTIRFFRSNPRAKNGCGNKNRLFLNNFKEGERGMCQIRRED
ncbi:hypothetical protein CHU98_g8600 [Xylaria longipes]|nr:hypothetical protein CHU98_g8600 [Xylaria longipes]